MFANQTSSFFDRLHALLVVPFDLPRPLFALGLPPTLVLAQAGVLARIIDFDVQANVIGLVSFSEVNGVYDRN
jgi:hypothetical protein